MKLTKKLTVLAFVIMAVCLIAGIATLDFSASAYTDGVEITSSAGNAFETEDKSYDKETSFVFSATVNFNSGDAAGLTFGETEKGKWAFVMDRFANRVKLIYFTKTEEGFAAEELKVEHFIGNGKMTDAERDMVEPRVRTLSSVDLKVAITCEEEAAKAEFYADGIRRFAFFHGSAEASETDLNALKEGLLYEGGNIGYLACNADVSFDDAAWGVYDFGYYTELYRNQFHFSPFAHWNNDPNGLVYYEGYYHLFYQHYPFAKVWGEMYWGHARSTDLMHWENLPICLYPERNGKNGCFGDGDGFMWSGSVRIYHKGESEVIDNEKWYGDPSAMQDGESAGLIGFYTRDGAKQDQMVMSSDDGGLSWTKRVYIPSCDILGLKPDANGNKADCRDPKVFTYDDNGNTVYAMMLTGMKDPFDIWFLKSTNLVDWQAAGGFRAKVPLVNTDATNGPECPDIAFFDTDDGEIAVLSLAGRGYICGKLSYEDGKFVLRVDGVDISTLPLDEVPVAQMDFGPDSYATQTFYIESGEYAGKTVSISWLSGVPGASASVDSGLLTDLRSRWNCGMTVPVIWGLYSENGKYTLTQTPITKDGAINKVTLASVNGFSVKAGENALENLTAQTFQIDAEISNPEGGAVAFRVRTGANEYTEIGWSEADGYYVDRSHTSDGGFDLPNYAARYRAATDDREKLTFVIVVDNGSVEAFLGNCSRAFYTVTFASPNSVGMSFASEKDVTFDKLRVDEISSVWRDYETSYYLETVRDFIELDLSLTTSRDVLVAGSGKISYETVKGADIVNYLVTEDGIRLFAVNEGEATIKATCGRREEYIDVRVYGGEPDSHCDYGDVVSGNWYESEEGYKGYVKSGDAFLFSDREGDDFIYSAKFDMNSGIAAALVFRAKEDMSQYIIANYDHGAGLVKLWSSADPTFENEQDAKADLARRQIPVRLNDVTDVTLTVIADGLNIKVYLNRALMIDYDYNENAPQSGKFGLNVCAAEVLFKTVTVTDIEHETYTQGEVKWNHTDDSVFSVVNLSWNNKLVDSGFYSVEDRAVTLSQNYMASLPSAGEYVLEISGAKCLYHITINVGSVPDAVWEDMTLQEHGNAVFYIGGAVSDKVIVNGAELDKSLYKIEGTKLTVYADAFRTGVNEISFTDGLKAKVTVNGVPMLEPHFNEGNSGAIYTALFVIVGVVIAAEAVLIALIIFKKDKKDGGNDQGRS